MLSERLKAVLNVKLASTGRDTIKVWSEVVLSCKNMEKCLTRLNHREEHGYVATEQASGIRYSLTAVCTD